MSNQWHLGFRSYHRQLHIVKPKRSRKEVQRLICHSGCSDQIACLGCEQYLDMTCQVCVIWLSGRAALSHIRFLNVRAFAAIELFVSTHITCPKCGTMPHGWKAMAVAFQSLFRSDPAPHSRVQLPLSSVQPIRRARATDAFTCASSRSAASLCLQLELHLLHSLLQERTAHWSLFPAFYCVTVH